MIAMTWWNRPGLSDHDGILCDGAVRSGKTVSMVVGFFLWSMTRFHRQNFALCGRTVGALRRNITGNLDGWLGGLFQIREYRSENKLVVRDVTGRENHYYLFGGRDESSGKLIQGMTLAGVLLDEAALMPRSFVEQACARCSETGSKLWFNCNPEGPEHWLYKEWIRKAEEKNMLHLHFTMDDNPALSEEIRRRYENLYTGVFYRRFILGQWCMAEGLVYDFLEDYITDNQPKGAEYYISVDYGTLNPFSAGLWSVTGSKAVRIKEYYYDGRNKKKQLTDEEYCNEIEKLAKGQTITKVIVDPSAASFITALKRRGFRVQQADNSVLDGIRRTAVYLKSGNIKIHRSCTDAIREFGLYRWDEKKTSDTVVKENDHAMDDIRYFCSTVMRKKVREI